MIFDHGVLAGDGKGTLGPDIGIVTVHLADIVVSSDHRSVVCCNRDSADALETATVESLAGPARVGLEGRFPSGIARAC